MRQLFIRRVVNFSLMLCSIANIKNWFNFLMPTSYSNYFYIKGNYEIHNFIIYGNFYLMIFIILLHFINRLSRVQVILWILLLASNFILVYLDLKKHGDT